MIHFLIYENDTCRYIFEEISNRRDIFLLFFLNELYLALKAIVALRRSFFSFPALSCFEIWFKMLFVSEFYAFNRKRKKFSITLLQSMSICQSDILALKKLLRKICENAANFYLGTVLIMKIWIDTCTSFWQNN